MSLSKQLSKIALDEVKKLPGGQLAAALAPALYNAVSKRPKKPSRRAPVRNRSAGISRQLAPVAFSVSGNSPNNSTLKRTIVRDEYLGTFASTGVAYNYTRIHIQPGDATYFPWLSQTSDAYALYRFERLSFYTVPQAATSQPGRVILGIEYSGTGVLDSLNAINNSQGSQSSSVWAQATVNLDKDGMHPNGMYKKIQQDATSDSDRADAGHIYVGFDGVALGVGVSLHARYEIVLFMPKVSGSDALVNSHTIVPISNTTVTNAGFTTVTLGSVSNAINPYGIIKSGNTLLLPKGTWEVECSLTMITLAAAASASFDWEIRNGENGTELSAAQDPGLRWQARHGTYHVTGTDRYRGWFEKLQYVSDGVTPYTFEIISYTSASNQTLSGVSYLAFSPLK